MMLTDLTWEGKRAIFVQILACIAYICTYIYQQLFYLSVALLPQSVRKEERVNAQEFRNNTSKNDDDFSFSSERA
jgi:hypothetical protein